MNKEKYLRQLIKLIKYIDKLPESIGSFVYDDILEKFDVFELLIDMYSLNNDQNDYILEAMYYKGNEETTYKRVISRLKEMGKIKD